MGVPGWLLRIVISFLKDRKMVVRFKGSVSSERSLPGGGPQGTILALLLFIVLVNDIGFTNQKNNAGELLNCNQKLRTANEIHLKFVDDLTIAERINLPESLVPVPSSQRLQPDTYHARNGQVFPPQSSRVQRKLTDINEYAIANKMKVNGTKTKVMLFNPSKKFDFVPDLLLGDKNLELVEETRLLGFSITSDLKWHSNTKKMALKAYRKLWILRRLKRLGAATEDLVQVYIMQVRCIMELGAPAWQGSITQGEKVELERVQKTAKLYLAIVTCLIVMP